MIFTRTKMLFCACVMLAALAATAAPLNNEQAKTLFNERGCNGCHALDEQRIGPPFQAVAARYAADYANDADAVTDRLAHKIREGGAGAWGYIPMVNNPAVPEAEARAISRWIMGSLPVSEK